MIFWTDHWSEYHTKRTCKSCLADSAAHLEVNVTNATGYKHSKND